MQSMVVMRWLLGSACAFSVGVSKTGVPGLAILAVPLMVLAVGDARQSAGWLLPLLCAADVFAVIYWRRHADARKLFSLAPWVLAGMMAGAAALALNERILRSGVGIIVAAMLLIHFLRQHFSETFKIPSHPAPYGITAGFATTVANAAGPVMNLYLLSRRLSKEEFIATGAWFFFLINLTKIPIYFYHGLISRQSLHFDLLMVPAVVIGAVTGRRLVDHIPARVFEFLIVTLTALSTLLLFR